MVQGQTCRARVEFWCNFGRMVNRSNSRLQTALMFPAIWADGRCILRILRQVGKKSAVIINSVSQGAALGECYKLPDVIGDVALYRLFIVVKVEFLRVTLIT